MRVHEIRLEGPLFKQWPPESHRLIVGNETDINRVILQQVIPEFARKAFRRSVNVSEISQYYDYIKSQTASGIALDEAFKQALTAILTSPRFPFSMRVVR